MILQSNAAHIPLADQSVQCVVTSPPYWGLRDYGTAKWVGGDDGCDHVGEVARTGAAGTAKQASNAGSVSVMSGDCLCGARRLDAQIGLEPTPAEYVANLVAVFREVWRVLRDDGTVWINLGDSYSAGTNAARQESSCDAIGRWSREGEVGGVGRRSVAGLKPKDLVGIPWRVAFALQDAGWYLRSDIIWSKPNPMPESVTDRPTKAHEYIFLLAKSERYFFDADAVKEPSTYPNGPNAPSKSPYAQSFRKRTTDKQRGHGRRHAGFNDRWDSMSKAEQAEKGRNIRDVWTVATRPYADAHFATFPEKLIIPCIKAGSAPGDLVLDTFGGAGTTELVADKLGRKAVCLELNPAYCTMAHNRVVDDAPLLGLMR